jgi:YVTN family beta-propeller protein
LPKGNGRREKMKENKFFSVLLKGLILFTLIYVSFPLNSECLERTVYVVNSLSNTVSVISTDTNTVVATIPVGSYPRRVAFTPDGSKAYVTNYNSNTISVIDVSTHTIIATVPVGDSPYGLAVSPDGSLVYVANNSEPWDTGRPYDSVSVIDTATNTVISMFPWGSFGPSGVAFTPDGKKVWISGPALIVSKF